MTRAPPTQAASGATASQSINAKVKSARARVYPSLIQTEAVKWGGEPLESDPWWWWAPVGPGVCGALVPFEIVGPGVCGAGVCAPPVGCVVCGAGVCVLMLIVGWPVCGAGVCVWIESVGCGV